MPRQQMLARPVLAARRGKQFRKRRRGAASLPKVTAALSFPNRRAGRKSRARPRAPGFLEGSQRPRPPWTNCPCARRQERIQCEAMITSLSPTTLVGTTVRSLHVRAGTTSWVLGRSRRLCPWPTRTVTPGLIRLYKHTCAAVHGCFTAPNTEAFTAQRRRQVRRRHHGFYWRMTVRLLQRLLPCRGC